MRAFNPALVPRPEFTALVANVFFQTNLDLEIGAGQGLHAVRYCQAHPERTLLAVERTHTRFGNLATRRLSHPDLTNLVPLHADAISIVTHFIRDHSLGKVFLLYPNPYPKAKQANLRWHNMPFLKLLHRKLMPQGELILATNKEYYAREAQLKIPGTSPMTLEDVQLLGEDVTPRTHFEKKYLARGERCWNLVFRKLEE
jgi:tRNA (guanine-N7-)-methyltransferase